MPTPATRTPVRIARGTYANLAASILDLAEGEICYATDQNKVYIVESGALTAQPYIAASGDTMTGALVMDNQQQVRFRETTANGVNYVALQAPASVASDKTITLPDVSGTVVTTGDTGSVTSTMIVDGAIVNADVNASAAIAGTKISPDFGSQNVTTTGTATAAALIPSGSSVPTNGVYLPSANNVAISTNGTGRLFVDSSGNVGISTTPNAKLEISRLGSAWSGSAPPTGTAFFVHPGGGTSSSPAHIMLGAGNAATCAIYFGDTDSSGRGVVQYDHSADALQLFTAGSERMRLTSAGLLGLGTSSPSTNIEINAALDTGVSLALNEGQLSVGREANSGGAVRIGYDTTNNFGFISSGRVGTSWDKLILNAGGGNVGIGTTSPLYPLDVRAANAGSTTYINVDNTSATATSLAGIYFSQNGTPKHSITAATFGADYMAFNIGSAGSILERARIDSSGRLLVGTSSARTNLIDGTRSASIQCEGTTGDNSSISAIRNALSIGQPSILLGKTRGTTVGSNTIVAAEDGLGNVQFMGADGTSLLAAASIGALVDGTPGLNDMPGRLVFSTTADGASSPTERLRISQNGVVTVKNGAVAEIGTLTDGATITPDFAANCNFTVTLGGNRTIANPSNLTAGQSGSIFLVQDGTGSRTASWGAYWDFAGGTAPTLSTVASAVDRVDYIVRSSTSIHTVFTANYS